MQTKQLPPSGRLAFLACALARFVILLLRLLLVPVPVPVLSPALVALNSKTIRLVPFAKSSQAGSNRHLVALRAAVMLRLHHAN